MGVKEQFAKIKDNWLIILLGLVVVFLLLGGLNLGSVLERGSYSYMGAMDYSDGYYGNSYSSESYSPTYGQSSDFAPGVEERKITKSSYLTSEIKRGEFEQARGKLGDIITTSGAYLLSENVNRYGGDKSPYFVGTYQLKVDATKYDAVVSQLKELGKVNSFRESQTDITGSYTNTEIELSTERGRLQRYQALLNEEGTSMADRLTLIDRIYSQERVVKYLEDSLKRLDQKVDYSTIYLTLNEKQSGYANIVLVEFSQLISDLVDSFNALLSLLFVALPWVIAIAAVVLIVRFIKSRRKKQ